MAESIASLVSRFAYDSRLRSDKSTLELTQQLSAAEPWANEAVVLVDTTQLFPTCAREPSVGSFSRFNPLHASLALMLADAARRAGCETVGLITPYRAQARLLSAARQDDYPNSAAATVHRFQGSERNLIIFDLVDGFPQTGASQLTGRDSETAFRLLNVAVSRARGKLVVLADSNFIRERHPRSSPSRTIVRLLQEHGRVERIQASQIRTMTAGEEIRWYDGWFEMEPTLVADVRLARRSMIFNLPEEFNPSPSFNGTLIQAASVCPETTVFAPAEIAQNLEETPAIDLRLMVQSGGFFGFVDRRICWIGSHSPSGAMVRIANRSLVDGLHRLLLAASKLPRPSAEAERALARIGGRCSACGETRVPRRKGRLAWVMRCKDDNHEELKINAKMLSEIADALQIRCPECQKLAVMRNSPKGQPFLGCPDYSRGCRGKPPSLAEIFPGS